MHRRHFGQIAGASLCGAILGSTARSLGAEALSPRYDKLKSDMHLGEVETVARVEDQKIFTEGPAVAPDGSVYFTNVAAEKIYRWQPRQSRLEVFRDRSNQANGLLFDPRGRLLACEGGAHRVTRTDLRSSEIEVLAEAYQGRPLAAPNDLALTREGRLFFSSRPKTKESNENAVYRRDPDGTLHQVLTGPEIQMPNGMGISPNGQTFYLIEAHPAADHHRDIRAYSLARDGSLSQQRVLIDFYPGRSGDGMCVGRDGRLFVAAGLHATRGTSETLDTKPGIHVISPKGQLLGFRETPEDTLTNCALDEQNGWLYATCGAHLLRMKVRGRNG